MCDKLDNYNYPNIEPRTKAQRKQYEVLRNKLCILHKQEDFVLKTILSFDWNRQIILREIENITKDSSLDLINFRVSVTAPNHIVDYCVSNPFSTEGWTDRMNCFEARASYVVSELRRYIC